MTRRLYRKDRNILRSISLLSFLLFTYLSALLFFMPQVSALVRTIDPAAIDKFDGSFTDWYVGLDTKTDSTDYVTYTQYRTTYCTFANTPTECDLTDGSGPQKLIRFDTAEELYRWSLDVSYQHKYASETEKFTAAQVTVLLDQNYVLGNNIDYSTMNAKTFSPIGYSFNNVEEVEHRNIFTGTFNGQGFAISNLYVGGYEFMTTTEIKDGNPIDLALATYYSMFTINGGTITNLGLINPTLELLNLHIDITKTSNLVGDNTATGIVDHCYVIDTRTSVYDAGIRYKVGSYSGSFSAAGVVHTNAGTFTNAYYSSILVINGSYFNKFAAQPVLYTNTGTANHLVYDSTVYLYPTVTVGSSTFPVTTPNGLATAETTAVLKSASSSLNSETDRWYFYASDCYPLVQGLEYNDTTDVYLIDNAIDMAFFARVLAFASVNNGVSYASAGYLLTQDIDMGIVAPGTYITPSVNFTGSLSGQNPAAADLSENFYIYNLSFTTGIIRGTGYYTGLFSVISGTGIVHDLNINDSSVSLADTETYYSDIFYVGMIAGKLSGGTIEDVLVDVTFTLGSASIGQTHAGVIAGQAAGTINRVSVSGTINGGTHTFNSTFSITPKYYIGGIVGSADASKLTMSNVVNNAPITGFGIPAGNTFNFASGSTAIIVKIGGIIGYIVNTSTIIHAITNAANKANITVGSVINTVSLPSSQNVAGVFGELSGYAPILETAGVYQFANFYNNGTITATYATETSVVKAAGIGISNTTQATEYALMFNHAAFVYNNDSTPAPTLSPYPFRYTGVIYDIAPASACTLTISRAYNYASRTLTTKYYTAISPVFYSDNNNATVIRYSANYGNIVYYKDASNVITLGKNLIISGITSSTNVSFLNVANYGDISIVNLALGTAYSISVAGIASTLTSGKYMKNCLNQGKITVAKIAGTGNATTGATNIYIGGLVNYNYSGDLQTQDASSQPIATIGIINSMNYGEITTSYGLKTANLYGITGTSNTFAAGIATLNSGSIQDCANLGAIRLYNSATSVTFTYSSDTNYAGRISAYTGGVSAGGVVAVTLAAAARVYDSANNGEIVTMAYNYARSGGVLSTCLYSEAAAGGITSSLGLADTIQTSILSNGLNFGDIIAVTSGIAAYTTVSGAANTAIYYGNSSTGANYYMPASTGTSDRPPVYSSAGGVIGYGLCVMRRMLNHGIVAATDVAGGIVGATYVVGGTGATTTVNITTAINYGDIKAINVAYFSTIDPYLLTYANISAYFYADGNTWIFPTGYTTQTPASKRGFGGVFGRLQRGTNGYMTSSGGAFDFIVNADSHIDLIGRLDQVQNWTSSSRFFQFNNAIYYSAKWGDTTQDVFTGYYYCYGRATSYTGSNPRTYTFTPSTRFAQVGLVSTSLGAYTTPTFTFPSTTTYGSSTYIYMYQSRIPVPWITENPSDAHITDAANQYMYHASFPMRTNANLTSFIYYMEYNLLASRFQTGGSNPRVNGMYVLSTTAGSTYGSVLPSNVNTDKIRPINEDMTGTLSLLTNYTAISGTYLSSLDAAVITKYNNLKQTTFNERCALIENPSSPVVIIENGGNLTVLNNATVNYTAKTLTYSISMEAFSAGGVSINYLVSYAQTSAKALIAKRAYDYYGHAASAAELQAYRALLLTEGATGVSTVYPAALTVTLPAKTITANTTLSIGYFTVYSEAFVGSNLFASANYYSDYQVYITFTPGTDYIPTGTIGISTVQFNGGSAISAAGYTTDVTTLGDVNSAGSIRFNFSDTKGVLTNGQDLKTYVTVKYNDGTVLNSSYYTLSSTLVTVSAGTGTGSVTITFLADYASKMGNYYMYYKYFSNSTEYNVKFDKAASSAKAVTGLSHYSTNGSVAINALAITSSINLGYGITLGASGTGGNFSSSTNGALPSYQSNTTYTVNYGTGFTNTFTISPFAVLTNAYVNGITYSNGSKIYDIRYVITAEDGTSNTYTHTMTERTIDLTSVLKNGNEVGLGEVSAAREVDLTVFTLDLGLDQNLDLYRITTSATLSYFTVITTLTGVGTIDPAAYGITFSASNSSTESDCLLLNMTYATIPGVYNFTFHFNRDGGTAYYVTLTTLVITKNEGTSSHLTDIRFSLLMNETSYPDATVTDSNGTILTGESIPNPQVYFAGFDYDGADAIQSYHYQIDGKVSNTPLNSYAPFMTDYLPYGATVARRYWNPGTSSWNYTAEVGINSTSQQKAVLNANYTIDPVTGLEGTDVFIQYRVTAEDGVNYTYYFVSVTDVTYNVTMIFDIYYCTGANYTSCSLASSSGSGFENKLVMINVKNYQTDGIDASVDIPDPANYPHFTAITGLNNTMTQFYLTYAGDYQYSFSRNISGFYGIRIDLPQDQYMNDIYEYKITIGEYNLFDFSDYVTGVEGKYFYIVPSTKNRTRRFNVYIQVSSAPATDAPWGLYDFFRSWWE